MRKGFSLITAIIFMVLIATLGALAISLSSTSAKQTTDIYLKEQSSLLARSATEYALLALSGTEINSTNCLNKLNLQYPKSGANAMFDINITIKYLGSNIPSSCIDVVNTISTTESNLTLIIDTFVSTNIENNISTEPIRFHRRTIQKQ